MSRRSVLEARARLALGVEAVLLLAVAVGLLVTAVALFGPQPVPVDPATLPAGTHFWNAPRGGSTGGMAHWVDCPSVLDWLRGDRQPLCEDASVAQLRGAALAWGVVGAAGLAAVVAVRVRRRYLVALGRAGP